MSTVVSLDDVLARPDIWRGDRLARSTVPAVSSGFASLDAELSGGGWPRGTLTEVLSNSEGIGECSLLLPALLRVQQEGKYVLLIAPPHRVHGPAWSAAGIDLARLIVVLTTRQQDTLWATEQSLACGALGIVISWVTHADERQVRQLQVAVSGSNALAFLFRPTRVSKNSSAASLRLVLSPAFRGALGVKLLKRRGPPCHRIISLDVARPVKPRDEHETSVARTLSSLSAARSQRPVTLA